MGSELTLVLPTRNRSAFLSKVLRYYTEMGCGYPIVIGDASDDEEFGRNAETIRRRGRALPILHQRHPPGTLAHESTVRILRSVETTYSVFCGDDDFMVPVQLARCVEFLERYPGFALACGTAASISGHRLSNGEFQIDGITPGSHRRIDHASSSRRMVAWARGGGSINTFAVQRTDTMYRNWRAAAELGLDEVRSALYEVCFNVLSVIQGQQMCFPALYHVMLRHSEKIGRPGLSAFTRLTDSDWPRKVTGMIALWANELVKHEGLDEERATDIARAVFLSWLIPYVTKYRDRRLRENGLLVPTAWSRRPVREIIGALPGVRRAARVWRRVVGRKEVSAASLLSPRSPYHDDFMPIYRILKDGEGIA